ncbi:MAG: aminotransferase class I/II-fold pyridoxal phosphate-dependent enzyme [Thaumarchaeota archaeon]|nr:aminotransferase class I/II-fold pyridoxal phosphate-dependent enzyme [Nitrososphaerota archaeon]
MGEDRDLTTIRREIRSITDNILELLSRRLDLSIEAGSAKQKQNLPIEDIGAEAELRHHVLEKCGALGIDPDRALRVLNILVDDSVRAQKKQESKPKISHMQMFALAKELEAAGEKIIHLEVGEPDAPPPKPVIDSAINGMKEGYIRYSTAQGLLELRQAIASDYRGSLGVDIHPDQVLVTPGSRFAIYLAISNMLRRGDGLITFDPLWPAYKECAEAAGGRAITIHTNLEDKWVPRQEDFQAALDSGAKMMALNYPCNPTGKSLALEELRSLVQEAQRRGVTVLGDETYRLFSFKRSPSLLEVADSNFVLASTFSKAYRMTGFRIGYVISSKEFVSKLVKVQSLLLTNVPEFIQKAAVKALECQDDATRYAAVIESRMKDAVTQLKHLPVSFYEPDGGFYIFPRVNKDAFDSGESVMRLLKEKNVAIAPGTGFGDYSQFLRLSICQATDQVQEGLSRISGLLK